MYKNIKLPIFIHIHILWMIYMAEGKGIKMWLKLNELKRGSNRSGVGDRKVWPAERESGEMEEFLY